MMAIVVKGDALKPEDVERAIESIDGCDAVVSTLGGTTADPQVDSQVSRQKAGRCRGVSFEGKFDGCGAVIARWVAPPQTHGWSCRWVQEGQLRCRKALKGRSAHLRK